MFRKPGHVSAKLSSLRGPGSGVPTSLITNRHLAGTYVGDSVVTLSSGAAAATFYDDIVTAGFSTNLKVVLDAGAADSYTSGQKWLDLAGSGYDFFRGVSASAASDDPTHNGTAGDLSDAEYFSFDGGDHFVYDSTNESWMNDMHKDNAAWTMCIWMYRTTDSDNAFVCTASGHPAVGLNWYQDGASPGRINLAVTNGSDYTLAETRTSDGGGLELDEWQMVSVSLNEATGSGGGILQVNDAGGATSNTFDSSYSSPSTSASTQQFQLGAFYSGPSVRMKSGGRYGGFFVWGGTALSAANITSVFDATKARWGI